MRGATDGGEGRGEAPADRGINSGTPSAPPPLRASGGRVGVDGLAPGREFDLIRRFFPAEGVAQRADVAVGPGDDCAVVVGDGIALSCDISIEGVHFRRNWLSDREIGYRAAAAALSDLAAVAARPIGLLASVALPTGEPQSTAVALMEGVAEAAERSGAVVLGGDMSGTPGVLVVDITVAGEARDAALRVGARPGDAIWVTGDLGAAAASVALWLRGETPEPALRERFAAPVPRTREALWLHRNGVLTALLDLSDGLAGDVAHIAAASRVAVVLDRAAVPIHPAVHHAASSPEEAFRLAVAGGEDYELCFTAAAGAVEPLVERFQQEFQLPLRRVGTVEEGEGVFLDGGAGSREPLAFGGFQHFQREP
jgi:thiamine-monophosphate kinase